MTETKSINCSINKRLNSGFGTAKRREEREHVNVRETPRASLYSAAARPARSKERRRRGREKRPPLRLPEGARTRADSQRPQCSVGRRVDVEVAYPASVRSPARTA